MSQQIVKSRINLLGSCKGVVLGKQSLKIVYKSRTQRVNYSKILGFCTIERSLLGHKLEITTDSGVITAVFFKIVVTLCLNIKLHLLRLLLVPYLG